MSKEELIKHAAVISVDGWIFIGKHHGACFGKAHSVGIKMSPKREDQGFITSKGRYIGRVEASELAFKNGQIDNETNLLFSEHLWCPMYCAKHTYSEIDGYVKNEKEIEL